MLSKSGNKDVNREAFAVFDPENKGYITGPGLKKVMMDLGEDLKDHEIEEMMSKVDLNGDGKIEFSGKLKITFIVVATERTTYMFTGLIWFIDE